MRITVGGVIVRGNRILLGRRAPWKSFYPDSWDVFGGHSEGQEIPEETLRRELQEELGITPVVFSLLAVIAEPNPERYGPGRHTFYAVTEWSGEIRNLGDEHTEIRWFSWTEIFELKLASEMYLELFRPLLLRSPGSTA